MTIQANIEAKITDALQPEYLEVANESHMHNVPPGSESHFKVTVVTTEFDGKMLVARHRILNQLLKDELNGPVHALSLNTLTPEEWQEKNGEVRKSPPCLGGSKAGK
ncbi:MAG: BolA family transcriptional regulator [Gammaproteobacteria bacterium]|nr:BolA family transcriptional regulator [Gammaproteobacteria bacterium]MDH3609591.1 BolA family transcriptional regulator [Gammaproteobacteria bacterium]NNC67706.1 BolA family transcriptional regulator [Gammaproteobacteria bacterium]